MAKILNGLYLSPEASEELRARAARVGCSISDLGDLFIRRGLANVDDEALRKWALSKETKRGRLGGGLTKNERSVMSALEALLASSDAWIFPATTIGARAGLRNMDAFAALNSLLRRGMVEQRRAEQPSATNRWGRPVQTLWMLPGSAKRATPPSTATPFGELADIRKDLVGWITNGADDGELWELLMPDLRRAMKQIVLKAQEDVSWSVARGLAERDIVRATGLRPEEIADPLEDNAQLLAT